MTREEQIDWLCRLRADLNNGVIFTPWNKEFAEALNDVLDQEPKTGHWISRWYAGHDFHFHVCSECNEEFSCDMETGISIDNYRYCPNCGAKMAESEGT